MIVEFDTTVEDRVEFEIDVPSQNYEVRNYEIEEQPAFEIAVGQTWERWPVDELYRTKHRVIGVWEGYVWMIADGSTHGPITYEDWAVVRNFRLIG